MKSTRISILLILLPILVFANGGEGHHEEGIPLNTIFWQFFNLAVLFSAIIYYTKDKIIALFLDRKSTYIQAAKKSQIAKEEAEKQFFDVKHKLEHLNSTTEESIARAEAEASDLRKQLIQEAEQAAAKIRQEAEVAAKIEAQRAQKEIHEHFVKEAIMAAKTVLTKDISSTDHQKLQAEFSKNIQTVHT